MIRPVSGDKPTRFRQNPDCAAFVKPYYKHQIELMQRCQNQGLAQVEGIWLCGTHLNKEEPFPILAEFVHPENS